jgi:signal transduction histidine kinase
MCPATASAWRLGSEQVRLVPADAPSMRQGTMLDQASLSRVLSDFARTLATDFPIQGILDHLVHRIVDVLPIDAAGVTLISPPAMPRFIAASDESALRFERLQTELQEGPCLAAYATDGPIAIADLALDDRFPRFAERAVAEGLVAVFTFPLRDGERGLGALDLYRTTAGLLSDNEMAAAQTLADVTTAYLVNAQTRVALEAASASERDALEKLQVIDRTKTEYLATVIHELRTPMTSISGYTEMLQDGTTGDLNAAQHQLVDAIDRNSSRLAALANDLLTLARLEQGAALDEHVDLDLVEVVSAARAELQALIDTRRLDVTFELPPTPLPVNGDARHLERLVSNLLTNAVKYTEDGGWVRCTLRRDGGMARLEVSDNGIGIPEADQVRLFTRFFRSSTAANNSIPGSGLGLNIIETIAHNHNGTVSVVSTQTKGTTFVVNLPLLDQQGLTRQASGSAPKATEDYPVRTGRPGP